MKELYPFVILGLLTVLFMSLQHIFAYGAIATLILMLGWGLVIALSPKTKESDHDDTQRNPRKVFIRDFFRTRRR